MLKGELIKRLFALYTVGYYLLFISANAIIKTTPQSLHLYR